MLAIRHSQAMAPNSRCSEMPAQRRESNRAWLSRLGATSGILLLGGSCPGTLPHPGGPITCPQ